MLLSVLVETKRKGVVAQVIMIIVVQNILYKKMEQLCMVMKL